MLNNQLGWMLGGGAIVALGLLLISAIFDAFFRRHKRAI